MSLDLTNEDVARQIAGRIRTLIARQDAGDVTAAARRLSRSIAEVCHPERVLAAGNGPAALDFLATVVRRYDADACWLLTGRHGDSGAAVGPDMRDTLVELVAQVGDRLLDEVRHGKSARRLPS